MANCTGLHHDEALVISRKRSCRSPIKLLPRKDAAVRSVTFTSEHGELRVTVLMDVATAAALRKELEGSPVGGDGTRIYSGGPMRP